MVVLTEKELEERIQDLKELSEGWLDGEQGPLLDGDALDKIKEVLKDLAKSGAFPLPYLYPTVEGHLKLEWDLTPWDLSGELNLETGVMVLNATDDGGETILNIYEVDGRLRLASLVSR
jgi:hypothetical protein